MFGIIKKVLMAALITAAIMGMLALVQMGTVPIYT